MANRYTSNDYLKSYNDLNNSFKALKVRVANRLYELASNFPDAPIAMTADEDRTILKAKSLTKSYINSLDTILQIKFIKRIEDYIEENQKHVQTKMF